MKLYAGCDLHSTNNYSVVVDETGKVVKEKRLSNDLEQILQFFAGFEGIESIVVESTYNWYWLVDGLMIAGYQVNLANTNAIQQYNGIKRTDDKSDARWLAELSRLGILNEGYIYPKEERGTRDLLRKRGQLVQHCTTHILSLQTIVERSSSIRLTGNIIKRKLDDEILAQYLQDEDVFLSAQSNLLIIRCLSEQINTIENAVNKKAKKNPAYKKLMTVPGIGKILALTILLETGEISRFANVGNFSSYCRCVDSKRESNGKKKGENNKKNGNKYLCWAFIEAANFAIRYDETIKQYYQPKLRKEKRVVAIKTIAHKLARACYYIIRDQEDFDIKKSFA